jgi:PPE-repeat protein
MGTGTISAQTVQQRLDAVSAHLKQLQSLSAQMPAKSKDQLSAGTQHMLAIADHWNQLAPQLARNASSLSALSSQPAHPSSGALPRGSVSDPSTDLLFSRMSGFTQSETSTAWCGHTVVVAYNDSGSFF